MPRFSAWAIGVCIAVGLVCGSGAGLHFRLTAELLSNLFNFTSDPLPFAALFAGIVPGALLGFLAAKLSTSLTTAFIAATLGVALYVEGTSLGLQLGDYVERPSILPIVILTGIAAGVCALPGMVLGRALSTPLKGARPSRIVLWCAVPLSFLQMSAAVLCIVSEPPRIRNSVLCCGLTFEYSATGRMGNRRIPHARGRLIHSPLGYDVLILNPYGGPVQTGLQQAIALPPSDANHLGNVTAPQIIIERKPWSSACWTNEEVEQLLLNNAHIAAAVKSTRPLTGAATAVKVVYVP